MLTKCQMSKYQIFLKNCVVSTHFDSHRHKICLSNLCQVENCGQNHLQEEKISSKLVNNLLEVLFGSFVKNAFANQEFFKLSIPELKQKIQSDLWHQRMHHNCIALANMLTTHLTPLAPLVMVFFFHFSVYCKTETHKIKFGWTQHPPLAQQQWQNLLALLSNQQCPKMVLLLRHQASANCHIKAVWEGWWCGNGYSQPIKGSNNDRGSICQKVSSLQIY